MDQRQATDLFATWLAQVALSIEGDRGEAGYELVAGLCEHCLRVMIGGSVGAYARLITEEVGAPEALAMVRRKIAELQP